MKEAMTTSYQEVTQVLEDLKAASSAGPPSQQALGQFRLQICKAVGQVHIALQLGEHFGAIRDKRSWDQVFYVAAEECRQTIPRFNRTMSKARDLYKQLVGEEKLPIKFED